MKRTIGLDLLIVLAALVVGVGLSIKPWQVYREQRELADKHVGEMRKAEAAREDLLRQRAKYESAVGREELARSQGYVKPGEQVVELP
jgi:cell division protein FtsB